MKKRDAEFRGLLYAGLMVDSETEKFWVLEFNARFGDPETQVLLPRMSDDLYGWCVASAQGDLSRLPTRVPFRNNAAVFVVAAAAGYPGQVETGAPIELSSSSSIFFSGVQKRGGGLVSSGGRVLGVLGMGNALDLARESAYKKMNQVHFKGMQYRSDIGKS